MLSKGNRKSRKETPPFIIPYIASIVVDINPQSPKKRKKIGHFRSILFSFSNEDKEGDFGSFL